MQLIKALQSGLQSLIGIKAIQTVPSRYTTQLYNQIYPNIYSYKYIAAFRVIDTVNSVVNKIATTAAKLPIYGYGKNGEDLPETDKLVVFLRSLTYIKKLEMYTWLVLSDEAVGFKQKTLGVNGTVENMVFLNPSYVILVISDSFPQEIVSYIYRDPNFGIDIPLEKDEVIFIHGFNPTLDPYERWRGLPKTDVLRQRLSRMESNMKNSIGQMQNGGVPGVMFQKDLTPQANASKNVIGTRQENFARFLKNPDNKGAPYFAAGEMGYFPIGSDLVDMASLDIEKADVKGVCNVWSISDILLNNDSSSTESNVKEMVRQMYTTAVLPYTTMVDDAFNNELVTDFGTGYRTVKTDYSDVDELQYTMKERIDALAAAPVMIPNDILEALGYDRKPDPLMDQPLIKTGYQPVDDFEPLPPIE